MKKPKAPIGITYYYHDVLDEWSPRMSWWTKLIPTFILKPLLKYLNRNFSK